MQPVSVTSSGFVGAGMLSGAVSGAVFASPPPSEIEEGLLQIGRGGKGEMHFSISKKLFFQQFHMVPSLGTQ